MELEVGWSRKGIFIKIVQNALTWESPQAFKRYWSIAFILVQLKIQQKFTSLRVQDFFSPPQSMYQNRRTSNALQVARFCAVNHFSNG